MKNLEHLDQVFKIIDEEQESMVELLKRFIKSQPVNPNYDMTGKRSEKECSEIAAEQMRKMGIQPEMKDVDLRELEAYKGLPGYVEGFTDKIDFTGRPNVIGKAAGRNPAKGRSLLLAGHLDVVAADNVEAWKYPPFQPTIEGGYLYGRGTVDMLGGFTAMLCAVEAIRKAGIHLDGDIWLAGIIGEEAGGTGGLMLADYLKKRQVKLDGGIMGEPTDLNLSLLCRDIQWVDVIVKSTTGHLEVEQPHWTEGGPVDAIQKARFIMDALDELNREWAGRPDKNHPLLGIPCQVKLAMIEGGHHRSSYPDYCRMSFNIQVLPQEADENGLGACTKKEFYEFMNKVFDTDPWMREHRPEIIWIAEADCSEAPASHPFVQHCADQLKAVHNKGKITGSGFHTDTGWFQRLNQIPMINFGPGNPALAHMTNEKCRVEDFIQAVKVIAAICIDWCIGEKEE
ncbi:M20/M25/M40 family metallo-hydrolase [Lachnospiraceae bacterium 62-35]